tara:strand:- start:3511 stop:4455 length:945 start_codon:yes stop_codon:yes gene_type:complete
MDRVLMFFYDETNSLLGAGEEFSSPKIEAHMNQWYTTIFEPWFKKLAVNFSDTTPANINRFNAVMKDLFFAKAHYSSLQGTAISGFNVVDSNEINAAKSNLLKETADMITIAFQEVLKEKGFNYTIDTANFNVGSYNGHAIAVYNWKGNPTVNVQYLKKAGSSTGSTATGTVSTTKPVLGYKPKPTATRPTLPPTTYPTGTTKKETGTGTVIRPGLPTNPGKPIQTSLPPVIIDGSTTVNCLQPPCDIDANGKPIEYAVMPDVFNTPPVNTRPMETTATNPDEQENKSSDTVKIVKNSALAVLVGWGVKSLFGI